MAVIRVVRRQVTTAIRPVLYCWHSYWTEQLSCTGCLHSSHLLELKIESAIIMLRNWNSDDGLCNGTRMICWAFTRHVSYAEIVSGTYTGRWVFIPRIQLMPSDSVLLFTLCCRQFPMWLLLLYDNEHSRWTRCSRKRLNVGLYLPRPVFASSMSVCLEQAAPTTLKCMCCKQTYYYTLLTAF